MNKTRFAEAEAFLALADHQGFGAAARELGVTQSTISRRVAALEGRIGRRLVERTTRRVTLTEAGQLYAAELREILLRLQNAEARVQSRAVEPEGLLQMTMPTAFGRLYILPGLARLAQRHPRLRFELDLSDRYVDLHDGGFDLAVRLEALPQSGIETRRLGTFSAHLCASPAYAARHGLPAEPAQIRAHDCLVRRTYAPRLDWRVSWKGRMVDIHLAPRITVNDIAAVRELAVAGAGLALLPSYLIRPELAAGTLVEALPGLRWPTFDLHVAYPRDRGELSKVAVVLEELQRLPRSAFA